MNIEYIYIRRFRKVVDLALPFNKESDISFDLNSRILNISSITDSKSREYYSNLDITGIIGINGVGKSTILDFIQALIIKKDVDGFIVFSQVIENKKQVSVLDPNNICVHTVYNSSVNFVDDTKNLMKIKFIHLNNLANLDSMMPGKRVIKSNRITNLSPSRYTNSSRHKKHQFDTITRFIKSDFNLSKTNSEQGGYLVKLNPVLPKDVLDLNIVHKSDNLSKTIKYPYNKDDLSIIKKFTKVNEENKYSITTDVSSILFNNLALAILKSSVEGMPLKPELIEIIYSHAVKDYINSTIDGLNLLISTSTNEKLEYLSNILNQSISQLKSNYLSVNDRDYIYFNRFDEGNIMEYLSEPVFSLTRLADFIEDNNIDFNLHGNVKISDYSHFEMINNLTNQLPPHLRDFIDIGWQGISSGEFAKQSLFSELYCYLEDQNFEKSPMNILFIDEADLYLHPEWQRLFIKELIDLINHKHAESNFKIIICTHSPIIISDLLPVDILSIQKDEEQNSYISNSLGFGTNITELFIDGMHIDSTFGELSRLTIEKILSRYKKNTLTEYDQFLISQIGNEHIRKQLSQ